MSKTHNNPLLIGVPEELLMKLVGLVAAASYPEEFKPELESVMNEMRNLLRR